MIEYYLEGIDKLSWQYGLAISSLVGLGVLLLFVWWFKRIVANYRSIVLADWSTAIFLSLVISAVIFCFLGHRVVGSIRPPNYSLASLNNGHVQQIGHRGMFGWRCQQKTFEYPLRREVVFLAALDNDEAKPSVVQVKLEYGCENTVVGVNQWYQSFLKTTADDRFIITWKATELFAQISKECPCTAPEEIGQLVKKQLGLFAQRYGLMVQNLKIEPLGLYGVFYN